MENDRSGMVEPTMEEWRELYQAAIEFERIGCWDWMWDTDMFGVKNPETGEIGYCCVMGGAGEYYGLGVYLGTEGLEGYQRIQAGEILPSSPDALFVQKCLMVSFEDRDFLDKRDIDLIKKLGLKFRGKTAWPLFRNYCPGYFPWYLDAAEVRFLTHVLQQTIEVSLRFKNNPGLFDPPRNSINKYLVRVSELKDGILCWRDEWLEPEPLEKTEIKSNPVDINLLRKIDRVITRRQGTWEVDFFYFPEAVREKNERPYYPLVVLWVNHNSGYVFNSHLVKSKENLSDLPLLFMKIVENIRLLPKVILVRREEAFGLLLSVARALGIKLRLVERLVIIEDVHDSMFQYFNE